MNKLGGYILLVLATLATTTLFLNAVFPVFFSPQFFPWSILMAFALISLIIFGAVRKIKAAEFKKNRSDDDLRQS